MASARRSPRGSTRRRSIRSEEHTSELQSQSNLVCRLLLEKKKKARLDEIVQRTRDGGAEIVNLLKSGFAYCTPASSAVCNAINFTKDTTRVLPSAASVNA